MLSSTGLRDVYRLYLHHAAEISGWLADNVIGQRKTAMIGIVGMAFQSFHDGVRALLFPICCS